VEWPCFTDLELGETEIEKSDGVVTTSVTLFEWVSEPLVPVIVNVYVPVGVLATVETVSVVLPAPNTDVGLKLPLAPVGRPATLKLTLPLKPLLGVTVDVYVVPLPCTTLRDDGVVESEKSGAVTISVTLFEWVNVPSVPVIVTVYVPVGVLTAVEIVPVVVPEVVTDGGLNTALAPVGRPLALNVTVPVYPLIALMVVV
jgi:hypothetical protein